MMLFKKSPLAISLGLSGAIMLSCSPIALAQLSLSTRSLTLTGPDGTQYSGQHVVEENINSDGSSKITTTVTGFEGTPAAFFFSPHTHNFQQTGDSAIVITVPGQPSGENQSYAVTSFQAVTNQPVEQDAEQESGDKQKQTEGSQQHFYGIHPQLIPLSFSYSTDENSDIHIYNESQQEYAILSSSTGLAGNGLLPEGWTYTLGNETPDSASLTATESTAAANTEEAAEQDETTTEASSEQQPGGWSSELDSVIQEFEALTTEFNAQMPSGADSDMPAIDNIPSPLSEEPPELISGANEQHTEGTSNTGDSAGVAQDQRTEGAESQPILSGGAEEPVETETQEVVATFTNNQEQNSLDETSDEDKGETAIASMSPQAVDLGGENSTSSASGLYQAGVWEVNIPAPEGISEVSPE